jgi:L-lactate utilization protein LutC
MEMLQKRLTEAGASLQQVRGSAQLARALSRYADTSLVLEDHPWLRAAAAHLPENLPGEIYFIADSDYPKPESVDVLVTIGLGAVPETGSVLLSSRSPQAFLLSLRPRRHIIIVPAGQASLTMAEALAVTAGERSGLLTWITGPSRTADIEKVLVLGAQGVSELVIIVYQER